MAQWDDAENYDQPYDQGGTGSGQDQYYQARYDAIAGMYRSALGREGSVDEINKWANGLAKTNMAAAQQAIYDSPEAKAYNLSQQAKPKPDNPDPKLPPGPGNAPIVTNTGGPAPAVGTTSTSQNVTYDRPPAYTPSVPAFSYADFSGPTAQNVLDDPDYQLTRDQGIQAIGNKNAALGTLNTGGTIGDFIGFASNLAHAKYGDIYQRDLNTYSTNRSNAFDAWKANYGVGKDVYDENYKTQFADPFANNMQVAGLNQNNNQFNAQLGQNNNQFNTTLDFNKWLQNYKMQVTDPFDMKYKLLGYI